MKTSGRQLFAIAGLSLASACASSQYMRPAATLAPQAADMARVVFLRPSSMAGGITLTIVDDKGRFIGDSTPGSRFAADVTPGEHAFIAWGEGTHSMKARLASGKTYYVEVSPHMGAWSARFHLTAVKRGSASLGKLPDWLRETEQLEVLGAEGQRYVDGRRGTIEEVIQKGLARFAEYDEEERRERTLDPEDGQ
ncbi:MAG: hypothetical protein AAB426_04615 [Myxococcota bacterium]